MSRLRERLAALSVAVMLSGPARVLLRIGACAFGALGLLSATLLAFAIEFPLRQAHVAGQAATPYFSAIASLVPLLALGLLVQLASGVGRGIVWIEDAQPKLEQELVDRGAKPADAHRAVAELTDRGVADLVLPIAIGLGLQFVVTEGVVLYSLAADVHERAVALWLGLVVAITFGYMVCSSLVLGMLRAKFAESGFTVEALMKSIGQRDET